MTAGRTNHTEFSSCGQSQVDLDDELYPMGDPDEFDLDLDFESDFTDTEYPIDEVNLDNEPPMREPSHKDHNTAQTYQAQCDELRRFVAAHGLDVVKAAVDKYKADNPVADKERN